MRRYAELVRRQLDVRSIILYGSYSRGTPHEYSDIDVAVIVDRLDDDWLSTAAMLYKLTRDISPDIEPVLLQPEHDRSGFLRHVMETGEVIYSRGA